MKVMQLIDGVMVDPPLRMDSAGDGRFGAPRGTRTHRGCDWECVPHRAVLGQVSGTVTKHGYPYGDDLSYRYIQVTDFDGLHHRYFYVEPIVPVGEVVSPDTVLGIAQDVTQRYPGIGMLPHVHYEVMGDDGLCVDPDHLAVA